MHVTESCQGGVSSYLCALVQEQLRFPDDEIYVIAAEGKITRQLEASGARIKLYKSSRNPLKLWWVGRDVTLLLESINPDVVHLHSTFPGFYGRIGGLFRKRQWATLYCPHGWSFSQEGFWIVRRFYGLVEAALAQNTEVIVNISENEAVIARKYSALARHNVVIYHGVGEARTSNNQRENENSLKIGFVGRFDKQKGLDILLRIAEKTPSVEFHLIGDFNRDRPHKIFWPSNIVLHGWVPTDQIDDWYRKFDALIIPSRWEGFGLVAVEAMRNKRPILASNRGALPELVIHGFNGYIFDINNAADASRILKNTTREKLRDMGVNAYIIYRKTFRIDRMLLETREAYNEALRIRRAGSVVRHPSSRQARPSAR